MSNFNNLQKEILGIHLDANKLTDKTINLILKAYKKSLEEVRTEIARIYIRYAIDGVIRLSSRQRYTVLKELERQLIEQATTLGLLDVEHTTNLLEDVYSESFYKTAYVLDSGVDISINFALLNPEMIRAAVNMPIEGKLFFTSLANLSILV
ncbi:MAG: phage head morphogenesis protein, partial [Spirochaetales bacterium]|nr:phage head morphogenesis protein [Spirochaetales bacterium]